MFNRVCILLCICLFLPGKFLAQNSSEAAQQSYDRAVTFFKQHKMESGLAVLDSAIAGFKQYGPPEQLVSAENDRTRARYYLGLGSLEVLKEYHRIEEELLPGVSPKGAMHAKTYFNIGNVYFELGQMATAQEYLLMAEQLMAVAGDGYRLQRAMVFGSLGACAEQLGNRDLRVKYMREAIRIMDEVYGPLHPRSFVHRTNLIKGHIKLNELEEAEVLLDQLVPMLETMGSEYDLFAAMIYDTKAMFLSSTGQHEEALKWVEKRDQEFPLKNVAVFDRIRNTVSKARFLRLAGQYSRAENMLLDALNNIEFENEKSAILKALSAHYREVGMPTPAVKYALQAERRLLPEGWEEVSGMRQIKWGTYHALTAINASVRSLTSLADSSGEAAHWKAVLEKVMEGERLFALLRRRANVGELMGLREQGWFKVYDCGMDAAYALYSSTGDEAFIEAAWTIAENSKAAVLLSSVNRLSPQQLKGAPTALVQKEKEIKTALAFHETLLRKEGDDDEAVRQRVLSLNLALDSIIWKYESDYPDYTIKRFSSASVPLSEARKFARGSGTDIWAYFFGERGVYGIAVNGLEARFCRLGSPDSLQALAQNFHQQLSSRPDIRNFRQTMDNLVTSGSELYAQIVAPMAGTGPLPVSVLIVPDGVLSYVPFEALPVSVEPGRSWYLIQELEMHYTYAFTSLGGVQREKNRFGSSLLAIAPVFTTGQEEHTDQHSFSWLPIPGALEEVKAIQPLFSAPVVRTDTLNYKWFLDQKLDYSILHFASHAFVDEGDPFRSGLLLDGGRSAGSDGVLYASDLYHISIPASLVVLSACNTGFGKVRRGEGVVSLAHGFSYAGSPAVVMTLWPANDAATSSLVQGFYKALISGSSKSKALYQSKNEYLGRADAYQSHPYFWAGMVLIGNNSPIEGLNSVPWYLWPLRVLVVALLVWFILATLRQKRRARVS